MQIHYLQARSSLDYIINNVKNRVLNNKFIKAATNLEHLALSGLEGSIEDAERSCKSEGFVMCRTLLSRVDIDAQFMSTESMI